MIAVIIEGLLLKRHGGIMVVIEYSLARLKNGNALTMNAGGVKEKCTAGWPSHFHHFGTFHILHLNIVDQSGMLLTMTPTNVIEGASFDICQVKRKLDFQRNFVRSSLIIP